MKAAVLEELNKLIVREVGTPKIKAGSILLKIRACGICGSDLRIISAGSSRVKLPAIIGHEIVGEIIDIGEGVTGFGKGERVAVGADVPCGQCAWCNSGMGNCCDTNYAMGYQFQGGYAEYCLLEPMVVKHGAIVHVPDGVSDEEATYMEPLACCINGIERIGTVKDRTVLIIGAGQMGCIMAMLAKAEGAKIVIISDVSEGRLALGRHAAADGYVPNDGKKLESEIMRITENRGADVIFTACSIQEVQEQALRLVAKRGAINFFGGLPQHSSKITVDSNIVHYRECIVTGSHGSVPRQNVAAMELIKSGKVEVKKLTTHRFGLDSINTAIEMRKNPNALRIIISPQGH